MPSHVEHLARTTRSIRRFRNNYPVTEKLMLEWVNNARLTASAKNLQPLKYRIVSDRETCAKVYETCAWAGYLTDWDGPIEKERPTGYIIMCNDTTLQENTKATHFDAGIAAQTIMLGATEEGFGGCIIMSFKKKTLIESLEIPEHLDPIFILALGRPIEDVRIVDIENGDYKYYRDENQVHYVPKRTMEEILF